MNTIVIAVIIAIVARMIINFLITLVFLIMLISYKSDEKKLSEKARKDMIMNSDRLTLEKMKLQYLKGQSQYRYALVANDSIYPYMISEKPFTDGELQAEIDSSYLCYDGPKFYEQVDIMEV